MKVELKLELLDAAPGPGTEELDEGQDIAVLRCNYILS